MSSQSLLILCISLSLATACDTAVTDSTLLPLHVESANDVNRGLTPTKEEANTTIREPRYLCSGLNDYQARSANKSSEFFWTATPRIVFTCTTFLSKPGKFEQLQEALSSLERVHSAEEFNMVERFLVINEYSPIDTRGLVSAIESQFPWAEVIQKPPEDEGQAKSLNLILDAVKGMDYWIQWEESWTCVRSFVAEAVTAMNESNITQLQISEDMWRGPEYSKSKYTLGDGEEFSCIAPSAKFKELEPILTLENWNALKQDFGLVGTYPLFSLRPSINRVAFTDMLEPFDTRPEMWPWTFEWEYGMRWIRAGGIKGIFWTDAAQRIKNHVSTYHSSAEH